MRLTTTLAIGSFALLLSAPARADIVEPGFVESCTMPIVQAAHPGEVCIACNTFIGEPARCNEEMSAGNFTEVCRSRGTSAWSQIGCRARTAEDPPAPPPPPPPPPPATATLAPAPPPAAEPDSSMCTIGHASRTPLAPLALAAGVAILASRRRARR